MKLLSFLSLVIISQCAFGTQPPEPTAPYDAIYNFGDSISDTGNSLLCGSPWSQILGKLPYGMTFFQQRPSGRASDGRLIVDFFAEEFGLPYTIPSLSLSGLAKEKYRAFDKLSINFAVVGATALDRSNSGMETNTSLSVQLGWFKQLKPYLCALQDCTSFFKKSLFFVGEIGGNDYNNPIINGKSLKEVEALVPAVVEAITNAIITLIEEGATELVVPGNFPIGCLPSYLTIFQSENKSEYDRFGCLKAYNAFSKYHNLELKIALKALRIRYPHAKIVYADYYGATMQYINSPEHYGFRKDTLFKACCGGGGRYNYNLIAGCGQASSTVCEDPSAYPNWDGIHFTEAAYRIISKNLFLNFTTPPLVQRTISGRVPAKASLKIE